MNKPQWIALVVIGGIALVAYVRSDRISKFLGMEGMINKPSDKIST